MACDSVVDDADTKLKNCQPPRIKASPVPRAAALADTALLPAAVPPPAPYIAIEALATDEEVSNEIDHLPMVQNGGPVSQRSMAFLLGGIFIGAGLAISGCVIALLIG